MPQRRRVMVIGLDGASFNFVGPMCKNGIMPNLNHFLQTSSNGNLLSSYPPITPAAWVTFMTGKLAGKHHVLDYEQFRFADYSIKYYSAVDVHAHTLWKILSDQNRKVAVINVPMTYPPEPVNGIMVAGHNVPNPGSEYTFPTEFKNELVTQIPDYLNVTAVPGFKHKADFNQRVSAWIKTVDHYHQATLLADSKVDWDFLMVVFPHTDIGHHFWPYMNPETAMLYPDQRDRVATIFLKLDKALAELFNLADKRNADVVIMSDHGHGTLTGMVRPNKLLQKWGYLKMLNPVTWLSKRIGWEILKLRIPQKHLRPPRQVDEKVGIDWSRTKAAVCQATMWAFLYLNVRGRQASGIVEPGVEYDSLREELIKRFKETTNPATGEKLFVDVLKPELIYGKSRTPWDCPDLLLIPPAGVRTTRRARGRWIASKTNPRTAVGTHLHKGLWMAAGPNIKPAKRFQANIQDLAPTILALLDLAVPNDMDGKVLVDIFKTQPKVSFSSGEAPEHVKSDSTTYSIEEEQQIQRHLTELGYFD